VSAARARIVSLLELGRYAEARTIVEQELAQTPDDPVLHGWHAQSLLGLGDDAGALAAGNRLVSLRPDDEWGHRICSLVLERTGRPEEATEAAATAVRLEPNSWVTHARYASAALDVRGRLHDAWLAAQRTVQLAPDEPDAHFVVGVVAQHRGQDDVARQAYERTLALDPEHAMAMNNLTTLSGGRRVAEAAQGYARALRHDPSMSIAQQNLTALVVSFPLRIYAGAVVAAVVGLAFVTGHGGPGPASVVVAALFLLGALGYAAVVVRSLPRTVRRYAARTLRHDYGALWNTFVMLAGSVLAVLICVAPLGAELRTDLLRPLLIGAVVLVVQLILARLRS